MSSKRPSNSGGLEENTLKEERDSSIEFKPDYL